MQSPGERSERSRNVAGPNAHPLADHRGPSSSHGQWGTKKDISRLHSQEGRGKTAGEKTEMGKYLGALLAVTTPIPSPSGMGAKEKFFEN